MELIERAGFLHLLQTSFEAVQKGEGHCIFLSGEAGIGKTSLVKVFCQDIKMDFQVYQGVCDALFTPRPLSPLYDIAVQMDIDLHTDGNDPSGRAQIFSTFFHALNNRKKTCVLVFEDIHWADEATLDFIKFLARRITQCKCIFILTYRNDEISSAHPLRNVFAQLPPDFFTRVQLTPLSKDAVEKMAVEKGYNGEDVYSVTGGNPFYVTEILASYSTGVPDNIKDSVLSVYNRQDGQTKTVWEILSVIPSAFRIEYLEKLEPQYAPAIERCLEFHVLIIKDGFIFFKHELFRRTIEISLSPLKRISLNKKILEVLKSEFEQHCETEWIIHHAKNANDYETVVQFAPVAAKKAALLGAHIEAARLYLSAIENYQGKDKDILLEFYDAYAYECYLTNQVKEAIIYSNKSLELWKEKNDAEKTGDCMRFLSWLWWINDSLKKAEDFAEQSIKVFDKQPSSKPKAMAFSNISLLKMFADRADECIHWGEKAIAQAKELSDSSILSDAFGNVGSVKIRIPSSRQKGLEMLQQSLEIGLQNVCHEHAARAYTNLAHNGIITNDNKLAKKYLEEGIRYCEENDLDLWVVYMLAAKAKLLLETGNWTEAEDIANRLLKDEGLTSIVKIIVLTVLATIHMRRGENNQVPALLKEAKEKAFETMELQRIIRALAACLEYEWLTGERIIEDHALDTAIQMTAEAGNIFDNGEFSFWLLKAKKQQLPLKEIYEGYETNNFAKARRAAAVWQQSGNIYQQALCLSDGTEDDKREAITLMQQLGANATLEKLKSAMRGAGIKNIPRGLRKSTQANPAFLTGRELDVLQLLKDGMQNKEIAGKLFISHKTVDNHISSILFKLDVNSRVKAVKEAVRQQIIQ